MDGDHARIRQLRQELEHEDSSGDAAAATSQRPEPDEVSDETAPSPTRSDSEQAQENLEHMLESGEENPIS